MNFNRREFIHFMGMGVIGLMLSENAAADDWRLSAEHIVTRWAKSVRSDRVWPEYPRPQMVRKNWINLNGLWDYALTPRDLELPTPFDGKILVPFPAESALSGLARSVMPDMRLWYHRTFPLPDLSGGKRLLLHFGAVDWETTVYINEKKVGQHRGGYTPFSLDVTDALSGRGEQRLDVGVWDPTDTGYQPCGKQTLHPQGIMYTATTGIWQTVWLEVVPAEAISDLRMTPDLDNERLHLLVSGQHAGSDLRVVASARDDGKVVSSAGGMVGQEFALPMPDAKRWSPDSPFLYDLKVQLKRGDIIIDEVKSYFGMRKIEVRKAMDGIMRLFLNDEATFMLGPLDQGFWPDGIYAPPSEAAMIYDIQVIKRAGFNMCRKHQKVEPDRWYHACDRLGLMVWQDMPASFAEPVTPEHAADFKAELMEMLRTRRNYPCIVAWVAFNEGWGQFDTNAILRSIKERDPSRLVDGPSGWTDHGYGDMKDKHDYPGPAMWPVMPDRASVLGEFGGLGLAIPKHTWAPNHWGYQAIVDRDALSRRYREMLVEVAKLEEAGLAAAVYTQLTDVETECNGLMTYDRRIQKIPTETLLEMNEMVCRKQR